MRASPAIFCHYENLKWPPEEQCLLPPGSCHWCQEKARTTTSDVVVAMLYLSKIQVEYAKDVAAAFDRASAASDADDEAYYLTAAIWIASVLVGIMWINTGLLVVGVIWWTLVYVSLWAMARAARLLSITKKAYEAAFSISDKYNEVFRPWESK